MDLIAFFITSILMFFAMYGLVLVLAGTTHKTRTVKKASSLPTIKVLLPAYKPDQTFLKVLASLYKAKKDYPVDVFILFQEADADIVKESTKYGFDYVERQFSHLPGNSYRHALQFICEEHLDENSSEYTLILDKDNIMDEGFFDQLARVSLQEYHLVQGVRKPIEISEGIQLFDAISERYNDLMLRKGKLQLGGVLEISGSAAVIKTELFKHAIMQMDEKAPGYDKNFMVKLLAYPTKLKTQFCDQLIVREEKTAEIENYQAQRLRWFGEQYFNAFFNAKSLLNTAFLKGKFRSLDYLITLIRPPRSLQLVASTLLAINDLIDGNLSYLSIPFVFNLVSFVIVALPLMKPKVLKQFLFGLHKIIVSNLVTSLTCLKEKYQNTFIHTR
ncbi:MAG: glycosyltransferase [Ekhidna sp.]|nr:glycosyltransferase [Ekhidna sp.]